MILFPGVGARAASLGAIRSLVAGQMLYGIRKNSADKDIRPKKLLSKDSED